MPRDNRIKQYNHASELSQKITGIKTLRRDGFYLVHENGHVNLFHLKDKSKKLTVSQIRKILELPAHVIVKKIADNEFEIIYPSQFDQQAKSNTIETDLLLWGHIINIISKTNKGGKL